MKVYIEILIPEVSEKAVPQLVSDIRDAVAGFGLGPVVSDYTPEVATVEALDAIDGGTLSTKSGEYPRPTAAIRTYTI